MNAPRLNCRTLLESCLVQRALGSPTTTVSHTCTKSGYGFNLECTCHSWRITASIPGTMGPFHSFIFFLSIVLPLVVSEGGFKLPLVRVRKARNPLGLIGTALSSDVSIQDSQEYAYIAKINIGGHDFPVLLDTGSSDLWVISSDCTAADCLGIATYQTTPTLSLTDTPFKLGYLMGSVSGTVGYETITLGNYQICSQVFAVADQATDLSLSATGYSGILGLSFPAAASISTTSGISLVQNLFSAFYDDSKKYFAFKLGRDDDRTEPDDSSFTIGQLDEEVLQSIGHNLSGDIQFDEMPVVARSDGVYDYWKVPLLSLTIDSQPLQLSPSRVPEASSPLAVLDTGTTLILGPTLDVENFWGSFGNGTTRKNVWSQWEVRCERAARIGFLLGKEGHEYVVDPQDISWSGSRSGDGWCLGGIQANDQVNSADWILGDVFLRNVYVKHQVPTTSQPAVVGLLQATNADSAMARFKEQRGQDSAPPIQIRSAVHYRRRYKFTPIVLLTITWAIGFIGGSIGRLLFQRIGRCLGIRRKYMSHNTANPEVRVYSR